MGGVVPQRKCRVSGALRAEAAKGLFSSATDCAMLTARLGNAFSTGGTHGGVAEAVPYLHPTEPFKCLGVWMTLTLNFSHHFSDLLTQVKLQCACLVEAGAPPRLALQVMQRVIKPKITHCICVTPFSGADMDKLHLVLCAATRPCMKLNQAFPTQAVLLPTSMGGVGLAPLIIDYAQIAAAALTRALNDHGDLGIMTQCIISAQALTALRGPVLPAFPTKTLRPLQMWALGMHSLLSIVTIVLSPWMQPPTDLSHYPQTDYLMQPPHMRPLTPSTTTTHPHGGCGPLLTLSPHITYVCVHTDQPPPATGPTLPIPTMLTAPTNAQAYIRRPYRPYCAYAYGRSRPS